MVGGLYKVSHSHQLHQHGKLELQVTKVSKEEKKNLFLVKVKMRLMDCKILCKVNHNHQLPQHGNQEIIKQISLLKKKAIPLKLLNKLKMKLPTGHMVEVLLKLKKRKMEERQTQLVQKKMHTSFENQQRELMEQSLNKSLQKLKTGRTELIQTHTTIVHL
jgi:hypothetical protein